MVFIILAFNPLKYFGLIIMSDFRIRKLPKDDSTMKSIVDEIQQREQEMGGGENVHEHGEHEHHHEHAHMDLGDALVHTLDHMLGQMAQIDERVARIGRGMEDISKDLSEIKDLLKILVKIQLAGITDNRDLRRELVKDILNSLER